ncbi:hypothetical protein QLQ09_23385 [Brucella sp. NM4]|uniref:hypothetical protein n=1 Tax=Brucella/Ochrobactrum group TaxID=2826938 RepID=UPI0024BCA066|nr:hypothetical protein [Brucella sp. NM4]WHS33202.1 hypothetical protein QLQ09_23385 [Brucella sp. NM4]WHT43303.1 hypothetical protein QLQ11_15440 [Ochrobactrum sp. SSR]
MGVIGPNGKFMSAPQRIGSLPAYAPAIKSDGGSTSYYELPPHATELNDLIEHKGMSFALGNIFKACYRFGEKDAASRMYDLNKIIYFAERLKALETRRKT